MYARGMNTRESSGHLRELYGIDASPDLISAVTDALRVKIRVEGPVRNKAVHVGTRRAARRHQGNSGPVAGAARGRRVLAAGDKRAEKPAALRTSAHGTAASTGGSYNIEYRVIGRDDGVTRHIATAGRTTFELGSTVDFIGAAIDVTAQRSTEAAIRVSEAQFRSFAKHSIEAAYLASLSMEHYAMSEPELLAYSALADLLGRPMVPAETGA